MPYWSAHSHSKFSAKDALPSVDQMVRKAVDYGQPALGLTDHGTMAGSAQLYTKARKAGIEPVPGLEAYVAFDRAGKRPSTMHLGLLAVSETGYRNLVGLANASHAQFKYKPMLDLGDLAQAAADGRLDGVACLTGCWFGLLPTLMRDSLTGGYPQAIDNVLKALAGWFDGRLYVEMQNHGIYQPHHDDDLHVAALLAVAQRLSLPAVITQDSHYCDLGDKRAHEEMKRLLSWSDDPDDAVFPGRGYHMADETWMIDHFTEDAYNYGLAGLDDLLNQAKVRIPELDTFALKVPDITTTQASLDDELTVRTAGALIGLDLPKNKAKAYSDRLDEELDVIAESGFAGYLLFTAKVTDWMRQQGIAWNVRGSASGSLACWLLGITQLDPIKHGLRFDRFLSRDRTKPPDIDIDVPHRDRAKVIDWLDTVHKVIHIGTWLKLGLDDEDGEQKGSLLVRWKMNVRKTGGDPDARLTTDEWESLREVAAHQPYGGYGVHAAGLLVVPDDHAVSGVPVQYVASSKTFVTGFDKDDVESMGLVKLDLLGLKTLTAIGTMEQLTGITRDQIPFNDTRTYNRIARGATVGLFQLEGKASRNGVKKLRPSKLSDVVAAMALFRPATMDSGATDEYIARKHKKQDIPTRHLFITEETKDTFGVLLYQEQVISVLKRFGLPIEDIEKARKAIKASNEGIGGARQVMDDIIRKVKEHAIGLSVEDTVWLEGALAAYAGYGFNKAHATAYGILAYQTGWYATHHPVAFWTGMLDAYTGDRQEDDYLTAAQQDGVKIWPPSVNKSSLGYTAELQFGAIRKGLTSIKGVGEKAALELLEHAPYVSLDDLAARVNARKVTGAKALRTGHSPGACGGVITALHEAGALMELPEKTHQMKETA